MGDKKKMCFAASSGGHLEQLMMLEPLMKEYDGFIVTEKTKYEAKMPARCYYMVQVNRRQKTCLLRMAINSIRAVGILLWERPDAILCTGVLAMIPLCLIGKLFGKKLIYIESFAKVTSPTLSGKLLYKYADRFYVQWEQMLKIYPDAIYLGGIY